MIKVVFFGQLRERLQQDSLAVEYQAQGEALNTVAKLRAFLQDRPNWQEWLQDRQVLIAVNQTMSTDETVIEDGDEVAFFPPVTGG